MMIKAGNVIFLARDSGGLPLLLLSLDRDAVAQIVSNLFWYKRIMTNMLRGGCQEVSYRAKRKLRKDL